jgi:hypothetical protein
MHSHTLNFRFKTRLQLHIESGSVSRFRFQISQLTASGITGKLRLDEAHFPVVSFEGKNPDLGLMIA